jgi:hypothetical protein
MYSRFWPLGFGVGGLANATGRQVVRCWRTACERRTPAAYVELSVVSNLATRQFE